MPKSIRDQMDSMFGIKRVNGEYVSKKEYNDHRKKRYIEILDKWIDKQESFEERQIRLRKIDSFKLAENLENIDKKFCTDIDKFVHTNCLNIKKINDEIAIFDNRLMIFEIGRNIVRNFILDRTTFLIRSKALYIPNFENESEISRWFGKNCNDLCLGISLHRNRHSKFRIKGSGSYSRIDHICKFIGGIFNTYDFHYCEDNNYRPFLNRYMDEKQNLIYNQFYEFIEADFMFIELEYMSSNFVRHLHPNIVDMVICYKKDKDLSVPVLELGINRDING